MKRMFKVGFKHWWYWLSPKHRWARKTAQQFLDRYQEEIQRKLQEEYINLCLYGCSISPNEFYGKGILDILKNDSSSS